MSQSPVLTDEQILSQLSQQPLELTALAEAVGVAGDDLAVIESRLAALAQEGLVICTRRSQWALSSKLELKVGLVTGHRDGYGWIRPNDGSEELTLNEKQMATLMHGDKVLAQPLGRDRRNKRECRVVRVLEPRQGPIVGRYFVESGLGFVVPDDPRICQEILIPPEHKGGARHGQVVVVTITERPRFRVNALGKVDEVLGEHMAPGMEIEIALRKFDIPHEWPKGVTKQLAKIAEEVPDEAKIGRVDLRGTPLVTIDGEDARDFDDAVFCQRKKGGGWRLLVAIADVSYYVRPGTALDAEAQARGTSVYFPNQVIPMLPEKLSNGLCSLNPQVDRLCLVCEMTVSAAGKLSGYRFFEGVMNSHARLTYSKVAALVAGDAALREQYKALAPHLDELYALYQALKGARRERGAVEFENDECRFIFNAERKIEQIVPVVRNDAHKIIEECMILANVAAARFVSKHKAPALFRVHESPGQEKLKGFRKFLAELGLNLGGGDNPEPKDYAELAERIDGRIDADLIRTMLLRSMQQAVYDGDNAGHFGLALQAYAHFTSPIRRYPDLSLHRTIKALIAKEAGTLSDKWTPTGGWFYQEKEIELLGPHCSMTERRADEATRDVAAWLKCEFMQDHVGSVFPGVVSAVTGFGLFVRLTDLFIDGLIHITALPADYYQFDAQRQMLIGENFRRRFRLGDALVVKVAAVTLETRQIDLVLAETAVESKGQAARDPAGNPGSERERLRRGDVPKLDKQPGRSGKAKKHDKGAFKGSRKRGKSVRSAADSSTPKTGGKRPSSSKRRK